MLISDNSINPVTIINGEPLPFGLDILRDFFICLLLRPLGLGLHPRFQDDAQKSQQCRNRGDDPGSHQAVGFCMRY